MSWSPPAHQFSWAVLKSENFLLLVRKKNVLQTVGAIKVKGLQFIRNFTLYIIDSTVFLDIPSGFIR